MAINHGEVEHHQIYSRFERRVALGKKQGRETPQAASTRYDNEQGIRRKLHPFHEIFSNLSRFAWGANTGVANL